MKFKVKIVPIFADSYLPNFFHSKIDGPKTFLRLELEISITYSVAPSKLNYP